MTGYFTLVLYFHLPAARESTDAHSCNIQPYCLLSHQIIYIYIYIYIQLSSERISNTDAIMFTSFQTANIVRMVL